MARSGIGCVCRQIDSYQLDIDVNVDKDTDRDRERDIGNALIGFFPSAAHDIYCGQALPCKLSLIPKLHIFPAIFRTSAIRGESFLLLRFPLVISGAFRFQRMSLVMFFFLLSLSWMSLKIVKR